MAKKFTYEALEQRVKELEKEKEKNTRIEEKFVKRQKYLESVFHHAMVAIITLDSSHRVLEWNPGAQKIFGYSSDETRGRDLDDLVSRPEVEQEAHNNTRKILSGQILKPIESVRYRKDGNLVHVIASGAPIIIDNVLTGVVALYTDISERKQAEEALRESEEKYKSLANNLNVGIFRTTEGMGGKFLEANPAIVKMFGFDSREEFLKLTVTDLYKNPSDRKKYSEKLLKHGAVKNEELQLLKKDGISFIGSISAVVIKNKKDIVKYYDGLIEDITARKQAEAAIRQSEEKYRTVLEANPDPVVVYDIEGRVVYFNPAFTRVFGWTLEERLGKKNDAFVPEETWRETKKMIDMVLAGERFSSIETCRYNNKGKIIPVSISGATYKDQNGSPIGSIINLRDISDQKKMEAQLQQSQKMEAIGTLAGGIAHDFNNILSGIFGYAQLAELQIDEPVKAKENINQIVKGGQRAAALVRQILTYSRQSEDKKRPLNVCLLLQEALKLLRSTIPSNIEIKENIVSKTKILADSTQIHQVIMNLCTNAYHAMSETGGVLTVGLQEIEVSEKQSVPDLTIPNGKYLKLEVSDTGHGIDADILGKIFDPYFTTKEIGKGTGLGLAVVDGIVKNHDGFIKSFSRVGNGSTFQVFLPVIEQEGSLFILEKKKPEFFMGTEHIMLVDDETDILNTQQEILGRQGYNVTAFKDGVSALQSFAQNPAQFDIIITDMTMPQMDGDEFSAEVLKIRKDMPIILCTGYHENFTEVIAREIGISKYVLKPVSGQQLSVLIREILDEKTINPYE